MSDTKEKDEETKADRQWIAPEFTVLSTGATAGGPNINTEAFCYHPS